jgi:hypothetical protein
VRSIYLAYLDPGSGSFIFQILIGVVLTIGVAIRVFWTRITSFFKRSSPPDTPSTPPSKDRDGE